MCVYCYHVVVDGRVRIVVVEQCQKLVQVDVGALAAVARPRRLRLLGLALEYRPRSFRALSRLDDDLRLARLLATHTNTSWFLCVRRR